jgi:hypothetical protein
MTRFFFNLDECGERTIDDEGFELAHIEAARAAAINAARDIIAAEVQKGRLCLSCRIEVTDAAGEIFLTVLFRDAVEIITRG